MKILLVVTKAEIGGAQQVVLDLARGLKERGHQPTVAYGDKGEFLPGKLDELSIPHRQFLHLSRSRNPWKGARFARELYTYLKQESFDLVHLHSSNALYGAIGSARVPEVRTVFTFHGMSVLADGYEANIFAKFLYASFFAVISRFLYGAIFLSESDRSVADRWHIRPPENKIIPNGISADRINYLSHEKARAKLSELVGTSLAGKQVIGSIGRLAYAKNYDLLISVADIIRSELSDTVYVVIGEGEEQAKLQQLVADKGLEDIFFFAGRFENAARLIPGFDVFTLPSRYEGLSLTLIEALAAGVPIVASDVGAAREVVVDPAKQLFAPGMLGEYAGKLAHLLSNHEERKQLANKQKQAASQFNASTTLDRHIEFYHKL